mgnify:CR=1 FL=1
MILRQILPKMVQVVETRVDRGSDLFAVEEAVIANAVPKRRREFTTVRACARQALQGLGVDPVPLVPGPGGAPVWPTGIVGSMTHCWGFRAAAVAKSTQVDAIGIDAEPNTPLSPEALAAIALPPELGMLNDMARRYCGIALDRVVFSAKEAVYKAWYPTHGYYIPHDQIQIDLWDNEFRATLTDSTDRHIFWGTWAAVRGIVCATAVTVVPVASPPLATFDQSSFSLGASKAKEHPDA